MAGLTTDFTWLTFGDFTGTTFTDESLPEDLTSADGGNPNNVDVRAAEERWRARSDAELPGTAKE